MSFGIGALGAGSLPFDIGAVVEAIGAPFASVIAPAAYLVWLNAQPVKPAPVGTGFAPVPAMPIAPTRPAPPFDLAAVQAAELANLADILAKGQPWDWTQAPPVAPPTTAPAPAIPLPPAVPIAPPAPPVPAPPAGFQSTSIPLRDLNAITTPELVQQYADWQRKVEAEGVAALAASFPSAIPGAGQIEADLSQLITQVGNATNQTIAQLGASVASAVQSLAPVLESVVSPPLAALEQEQARLDTVISGLQGTLQSEIEGAQGMLQTALTSSLQAVEAEIGAAIDPIAKAMGQFDVVLSTELTDLQATLAGTLGKVATAETDVSKWLNTLVASPELVVGPIADAVKKAGLDYKTVFAQGLPLAIATGITAVASQSQKPDLSGIVLPFIGQCPDALQLAEAAGLVGVLATAFTAGPEAVLPFILEAVVFAIVNHIISMAVSAMLEPAVALTQQKAWASCPERVLSPGEAAVAKRLEYISQEQYEQICLLNGYSQVNSRLIQATQRSFVTPDTLFANVFRSVYNGGSFAPDIDLIRDDLEKLGYDDRNIELMRNTALFIPPITDVLHFMLRDVFIPSYVETYQMDAEFPENMLPMSRQLGMPDSLAHLYWQSHWILPSVTQAYEMFWRKQISADDLNRLLRAQGFEPYWRPKLTAVAYNPLNRIDIRRGYQLGVLTAQDVVAAFEAIGYSPELAQTQLKIATAIKQQTLLTQAGAQRRAGATASITAFRKGVYDEATLASVLSGLGFDSETVNLQVAAAKAEHAIALMEEAESAVRSGYIARVYDQDAAQVRLAAYGFSPGAISERLSLWSINREVSAEKGAVSKHKELSEGGIVSAYKEHSLSADQAQAALHGLGYSDAEIGVILATARAQETHRQISAAIAGVKAAYTGAIIDRRAALTELGTVGITGTEAQNYLAEWQAEFWRSELARIRTDLHGGKISVAQARHQMMVVGLAAPDIDRIMKYWAQLAELPPPEGLLPGEQPPPKP